MEGSDRARRRSRVDLYLPRHVVEEVLEVLRPRPVPSRPQREGNPTRVTAKLLAGGCKLYRLPG